MNKEEINKQLVNMRHIVAQARVHIISKLTREIKKLKDKKGTEEQKTKNLQKAQKFTKEVLLIKTLVPDEISKFALLFTGDPLKMMGMASLEERVKLRFAAHKNVAKYVETYRAEHPDWELKLPVLIVQLGHKYREQGKTKTKSRKKVVDKKQENLSGVKKDSDANSDGESDQSEETSEPMFLRETDEVIDGELENNELGIKEEDRGDAMEVEESNDSLSSNKLSSSIVKDTNLANKRKGETIQTRKQGLQNNTSTSPASVEKEKPKVFLKTKASGGIAEVRRFSDLLKSTENEPENTDDAEEIPCSDEEGDAIKDPFFLSENQREPTSEDEPEKQEQKEPIIKYGVKVNRKLRRMMAKANSGQLNLRHVRNKNLVNQFKIISKGHQNYDTDNLHPSWAAKQKERKILPFQGKKKVFTDAVE